MIAGTDAKQRLADAAPLRRVSAKSLISKATDARTRRAQQSEPTLRGDSRKRGATVVPTARTPVRPHRAVAVASCGRSNLRIPMNSAGDSD